VVYGHFQQIHFQRASLYGPPKFRPLATNAASGFAASVYFKPLATLPVAAGTACSYSTCNEINPLKQYQPIADFNHSQRPLAAISTTCKKKIKIILNIIKNLEKNEC